MLKITRLEILEVRIPFRFTFKHALASRSEGHNILLRATDPEGRTGHGECVPRSYVTGETPHSVKEALAGSLAPPFLGTEFRSFADVEAVLRSMLEDLPRDRHAAFCALELALLDLAGKVFGCSAGEVAGPVASAEIAYSGVVSAESVEDSVELLQAIRRFAFPEVKVKVGLGREADVAVLTAARRTLGEECALRIDANCAWEAEEALRHLEAFEGFRLQGVEQPVRRDDLDGLAWLTARSPVPVIVDESLASTGDARELIERKACHHFNIRVSKCGGLINSVRLRDLARDAGMGCQLGAQVGETAILSAAGRHFGTRSPGTLFFEGSFGTILLEEDIGKEDLTIGPGGRAPAITGPGLGVELDPGRLERYLVATTDLGDGSCPGLHPS